MPTQEHKDTISDNIVVDGRLAVYDGPRQSVGSSFPMTEQWEIRAEDYVEDHLQWRDARTSYDTSIEIKGAEVRTRNGPGEIVVHREAHRELLRRSRREKPNHYHCVLYVWISPCAVYVVDHAAVPVDEMDDVLEDYSFSAYQKEEQPERAAAHVPWPAIPQFSSREEEIQDRARTIRENLIFELKLIGTNTRLSVSNK